MNYVKGTFSRREMLGSGREAVVGKVLPHTKELEPDSLLINWDVILEDG